MRALECSIFMDIYYTEDVVIEGNNGVLQDIDSISYKINEDNRICTIVLVPEKD